MSQTITSSRVCWSPTASGSISSGIAVSGSVPNSLPGSNGAVCSIDQESSSNADCGIVSGVVDQSTKNTDSAWDVDLMQQHFHDMSEPTVCKESCATESALVEPALTAKLVRISSISALQLSSLDDTRARATLDIEGELRHEKETNLSLSWPFDTSSRIIVQKTNKLSVHCEYGNVDLSNRALFPTTFGTSTTFANLATVNTTVTIDPPLTIEGQAATAPSTASHYFNVSTQTPNTPCQQGTTWRWPLDFHLDSGTQEDASEIRMATKINSEKREDEGMRLTAFEASEQSSGTVCAVKTIVVCPTNKKYPLVEQPIPISAGQRKYVPSLVGSSLQNLLNSKETKSARDFECVQNRQLLHQLIYKQKFSASLQVPTVAHTDIPR